MKRTMERTTRCFFVLLAGLALLAPTGLLWAQQQFVVIVNASNPVETLSRQEVSRMFLKTRTRWDHGERVRSSDLPESSETRQTFSYVVHGQSSRRIEEHWQTLIFSGREVPPPKKASEEEVVDYVGRHLGGIGYVSPGTPLGAYVKPIVIED